MTEQEAVRRIKNHNEIHSRKEPFYAIHITEALKMAVEALEKQIPKKPKVSFQSEFYWCPNCECAIKMKIEEKTKNIRYCPFCGQAIDWSDRNA